MYKQDPYIKAIDALEEIGADPDTTYLQETIRLVLEYLGYLEERTQLQDLEITKLQDVLNLCNERDEHRLLEISRLRKLINPATNK